MRGGSPRSASPVSSTACPPPASLNAVEAHDSPGGRVAAVSELNSLAINDVGDVVLSDAHAIEALADPDRFRLFGHVQRNGPVSDVALGEALGVSGDVLRTNLRMLADVGLVTLSTSGWAAPGRGL